ncbi:hypothetical protein AGMMS50229_18890 [Campylobacterota bacterium]|nr:hypothetical protein AGMMS50229_18890 [Campylobacterota bacterium]
MIVWDNLPAHQSAMLYFEKFYPDWFEFEPLPAYSPQLNPVEGVWSVMKCSKLANRVFEKTDDLIAAATQAANEVNQEKVLMKGLFNHAKIKLL